MADKVDFQELEAKLEEIFEDESKYGFSMVDFLLGDYDHEVAEANGVVWIEQDGGGEGGSEHCETVFSLGGVFYKVTYNYYSHHGYDMDYAAAYVVTPVQKTITAYE